MKRKTIVLGSIAITHGRLIIGDADFPPVGTEITGVPNGEYPVKGVINTAADPVKILSFHIVFAHGGVKAETVDFSIDGGVIGVEDPAIEVPRKWLQRWRERRAMNKRIMQGLRAPRLYNETFKTATGRPWAIAFYAGDGTYDVEVERIEGLITSLRCTLKSK